MKFRSYWLEIGKNLTNYMRRECVAPIASPEEGCTRQLGADRADELLELLERGDLKTAGGVLRPKTSVPGVELSMERCAGCLTSPAILTIAALKRKAQGKTDSTTITAVRMTPVESETILAGVQGRRL